MRPSRAAALAVIARAIDAHGDIDTACGNLARVDPLLRRRVRREVRDAYVDAQHSTHLRHGDVAGVHALRLAYLRLTGAEVAPAVADDAEGVSAAFEAARSLRGDARPGFWWWSALLVLVVGIASSSYALVMYRAFGQSPLGPGAIGAPPPRGAIAGRAPHPGDPAVAHALGEALPEYLIRLDRLARAEQSTAPAAERAARAAEVDEAARQVLAKEATGRLGPDGAAKLAALLAAARESTALKLPGARARLVTDVAGEPILAATAALDEALATAGLGYFVDGDVLTDRRTGKRLVVVYAFTIESASLFTAGSAEVRVLDLRRLDHLNWSQALLGFTRPHLREALVLLDQVDEQLVSYLLPGLAPGERVALFGDAPDRSNGASDLREALRDDQGGDPASAPGPDGAEATERLRAAVEARAGELARQDYGALKGQDPASAAEMGRLLARRRAVVDGMARELAARQIALQRPVKLRLDPSFTEELRGLAPASALDELRALDEALAAPAVLAAYATVRDALVDSVERHEVQHRLDYAREGGLPMPPALAAYVGPAGEGEAARFAAQARAELSAYLAELARDTRAARSDLTMIARFLFDPRLQGIAECYAALVIVDGLAAELDLPKRGPLVRGGHVDRAVVAELYLALTAQPPDALRAAAARRWRALFLAELPTIRALAPSNRREEDG
jgi:hypothetical protein